MFVPPSQGGSSNLLWGSSEQEINNTAIENARVLLAVGDGSNYPYGDSVTITSSGTTATVSHTSHGMATNDYIIITGANEDAYNGVFQITYSTDNSYTYTMPDSASSPATGTITATFAVISGLTNSSGIVSDSRSWTSARSTSDAIFGLNIERSGLFNKP